MDHATRDEHKDTANASWQMNKDCVILFAVNYNPAIVKRALSLLNEKFVLTGNDVYAVCERRRASLEGETNAVVGLLLDNLQTG
jgi:hypothetical protein